MTDIQKSAQSQPIGETLEVALEARLKALEFRDKELHLREKELSIQKESGILAQWNTPIVAAIVAGLVGYIGTLISSSQNRRLERDKQEGLLVLEALKTQGSLSEREKQAAANLVFFAEAGLISINNAQLKTLRTKSQGAGPALSVAQGVEFKSSAHLNQDLKTRLQGALAGYQSALRARPDFS